MLKTKHFEILLEIKKEKHLKKIAEIFNQTERNIRYKIGELNEALGEEKIFIKKREIISSLTSSDIEKLIEKISDKNYVYEQKERLELIILNTIFLEDDFTLYELVEKLGVSKSTIKADINVLTKRMQEDDIYIEQRANLKYRYIYKELEVRYFMSVFLYKYITFNNKTLGLSLKENNYFEKIVFKILSENYLKEIEETYDKIKSLELDYIDETINFLALFIVISKKRTHKSLGPELLNKTVLRKTEEYEILRTSFPELKEMDILSFADYLIRISCDEKEIYLRHKNWIEIEIAVYNLLKRFENYSGIKLLPNKQLIRDFLFYIKPLIYRSTKKIELKNSILKDILELYSKTFYALKKSFAGFEKVVKASISDDEIAFLVPTVEMAIRKNTEKEKTMKSVVIVSEHKQNIANFLKDSLENTFYAKVQKVFSVNKFMTEYKKENIEEYDLIVSTSKLEINSSMKKVCRVNPILTEEDLKKLLDYGLSEREIKIKISDIMSTIKRNSVSVDLENMKKDLIEEYPDKFYDDLELEETAHLNIIEAKCIDEIEAMTWKDGLIHAGNLLGNMNKLTQGCTETILEINENSALSTFLGKKTVLFYIAPKDNCGETGISLVRLKESVVFKNKKIKIIICFSTKGGREHGEILFKISDFLGETSNEEMLLKLPKEKIYNYLTDQNQEK